VSASGNTTRAIRRADSAPVAVPRSRRLRGSRPTSPRKGSRRSSVDERRARAWVRETDAQHSLQVAAAEDQQPVKTLAADGANEALRVRVCLWCADRRVDHFDPFAAEDLVEGRGELAVAVVDQEAHPLEDAGEAEIPRLLGDPGAGGVGRAAGQVDVAAFELDEEQDVEATERDCLDGEGVAGDHARGLPMEEFAPPRT
jgi:hypothetical protein